MSERRRTLTTVADLVTNGLVATDDADALASVGERYAIALTPELARVIDRDDPADPIARQFVPDARELSILPGELADPIGDDPHSPVKGIVHRYNDRVLLKVVGTCPVYCRFCFRREMVGPDAGANLTAAELDAALGYIRATPRVREVIMTGGDPFILSPRRAGELTQALSSIPHVEVLRWHTRVPVASPQRVTADLAAALKSGSKAVRVAVHVNHVRELTPDAIAALGRLADAGIGLLSQSVLLAGVNDDAATLAELVEALGAAGVRPYYLHHPDLAPGTVHFRLPLARGLAITRELRRRLPGVAVPSYVLDIPGGHGKVAIDSDAVRITGTGARVTDRHGVAHAYEDLCDNA